MNLLAQQIHSAVPVIGTDDIEKSLSFYVNVLGFSLDFKYGEPAVYAGVKSGDVEIYISKDPELVLGIKEKGLTPEVFIWVSDAVSLFKEHVKNGAEIIEPLTERPWGALQYVVKEINGYHLKFAQPK